MKLVVNRCFGGFGLSPEAIKQLAEMKGRECHLFHKRGGAYVPWTPEDGEGAYAFDVPNPNDFDKDVLWDNHYISPDPERDDPHLVQVVELMGDKASGCSAKLEVVEIPDDVEWEIMEYDGQETIYDVHRVW